MKEDSAVVTVWEVLIVAQNQRHIFLLLFCQSAVIVNALQISLTRELHDMSWRNIVIVHFLHHLLSRAMVSRRSKPAVPAIVFINEVSLITPIGLAFN